MSMGTSIVRRPLGRTAGIFAAVLACLGIALATHPGVARAAGWDRQVTVTMDRSGIPHITAKNFTALGYGEGYEFASDNLCTFANDIITVEGQRSKYFGSGGLAVNYSAGTSESNLTSDLYWKYVQASGIVEHELKAAPPNGLIPQVKQIYTGFIAGYNAYLKSGKLNDPTCKGKAWVHPIDMTDMLLRGYQIVTEASSAQFVSGLVSAKPPKDKVNVVARTPLSISNADPLSDAAAIGHINIAGLKSLRNRLTSADRAEGSNGIGLGSQDTQAGTGMVLANPHFPWRGTERFWLAQLQVPGQYDMEGGTLEGFPLIGIGFNRNIAWTHTVSTDMRFIAYQLKLVAGHPTEYYIGSKVYKMQPTTVTVKYGHTTVHHTFYRTKWGTVAVVPAADYGWSSTTAYAVDDFTAPAGARAADEYFNMGRAKTVQGLYAVEAKWLAIPTFNTIAADDKGNAYYGDVGATPAVSAAEITTCMPSGLPQVIYAEAGVVTLDGSDAACAPANYAGTPQKGIFSGAQLPHLFRTDYVENSNDSYWLANPSDPLTGFSPIIGQTDVAQNGRTRLGNALIAARVAGTDGLGAAKFTIYNLQKMWEGDGSQLAHDVLGDLVTDCNENPTAVASNEKTVNLAAACSALSKYNGTGKLDAVGGWLFSVWAYEDRDYSDFYSTPFSSADPLTTPTGLNTTSATPLMWLADAVQNLQAHHIPMDATIGGVQHAPQSAKIKIPGCFGESAGQDMGCFNAIYSPTDTPATDGPVSGGPYGQVNDGSSIVMTTQLNPSGPMSEGILTYSQATNPKSPWYSNLTKLYSEGKWIKFSYTAAELKASHPLKTVTLTAPKHP